MTSLIRLTEPSVAHDVWAKLQKESRPSFFLSWNWIGTWLESLPSSIAPYLVTIGPGSAPIAAAILTSVKRRRYGVLPVRALHLHSTGDQEYDCIAAEYGGLISSPEHEASAWTEFTRFLNTERQNWDELIFHAISPSLLDAWNATNSSARLLRRDYAHYIGLDAVSAAPGGSCVSLLPSRARSRVRSTRRAIERRAGPIAIHTARDVNEAMSFLSSLKTLHQRRWVARGQKGAFGRPFFEVFHRRLIANSFDDDVIRLIRLDAGTTTLGYVYNFAYQDRVYFYQSGINYDFSARNESLGLLIHAVLIDHAASQGYRYYDMLAGASQYKRALAKETQELLWVAIQQPRVSLALENIARSVYRRMKRLARRTRGVHV